jgi:hypothetical protein
MSELDSFSFSHEEDSILFEEKLKQIFNEATFSLENDVDYIWDNYFKIVLDSYKITPEFYFEKLLDYKSVYNTFPSSQLPSNWSKQATAVKPCEIRVGCFTQGSRYINTEKTAIIEISLPKDLIIHLDKNGLKNKQLLQKFPVLIQKFSKPALKSTIAHELTHWLSDSLRNNHLLQSALNYNNKKEKAETNKRKEQLRFDFAVKAYYEIDACIHGLKEVKRKYSQTSWDNFSFNKTLMINPTLLETILEFKNKEEYVYDCFIQKLFNRLLKEDLLGKNMKPPSYEEMKKIDTTKRNLY